MLNGTASNLAGANGSFTFTVKLAKGGASATVSNRTGTIVATTYVPPTGNDDIQQPKALKAWMQNGRLHVSGLTVDSQWSVYSISGMLVYTAKATAEEADTTLPVQGIYIVVSEQQRAKIPIK